ncbi:MAG: DUF1329 domain-containing protein [Deltaproteobacteria bacterium]|nr:DUF1329 domain-containing protein [Deltaproteobacteria bacterium]MBI3387202.1 DUF1329 domain-containing protein [Deltaproteobacteria bacterium]
MNRVVQACVLVVVLSVAGITWADSSSAGLKAGDVLTQANANLADGLLPPEILRHYQTGEYLNTTIADWPNGLFKFDPEFLAATETNAGKYKIDTNGTVVDAATGQQPPMILGFPFPKIDPADPTAGTQVLWNYVYGGWYILGSIHSTVELNWVKPNGLDRKTTQDISFLFYDGQGDRYRKPNPQNFSMQFLATAMTPTDLNGTTALTWRYRDPAKRDSNWVYVPALRRVRAVSPANRSDGFLGSDMSQDDGPFFDGKPEDFNFKLVGEKDQYRFVDPLSLAGKSNIIWLPNGGWRAKWPKDVLTFGYEDPNFKGIGWAPVAPVLAKRAFWVIEATPKDKYYLYGRIELFIDKETYEGAWNRKFSWSGDLLNTLQVMTFLRHKYTRPDGGVEYLIGSNMGYRVAENVKMNRATTAGTLAPLKEPASDTRVPIDPTFFDMSTLSRFGK